MTPYLPSYAEYVDVSIGSSERSVWFSRQLHRACEQAIKSSGPTLKEELLAAIANEVKSPAQLPMFIRGHDLHPYVIDGSLTSHFNLLVMTVHEAPQIPETIIECVKMLHGFHELRTEESVKWDWFRIYVSRRLRYRLAKAFFAPLRNRRERELWLRMAFIAADSELLSRLTIADTSICAYRQVGPHSNIRIYMMLESEWLLPPELCEIPF